MNEFDDYCDIWRDFVQPSKKTRRLRNKQRKYFPAYKFSTSLH